ncbi:MAG TPA: ABC transporter ATP-binding protein [Gemmatimonadales bacterium]|nr:ABC transporter ATP-binding protein [Gemmatimonadales bacterium]
MASVTLKNLTKQFNSGNPALRDLSLEARDGEFLVLLGPTGCGKTTTLRCIAGLEEPTDGQILIGDRDVTQLSPGDRDVAMVFQNYSLYPHLTVRDNIGFPLALRRVPRGDRARRVEAAAERLGLTDLLDRRPGELSGGERQRVALGRAIVREPKVFLFDEPLSNLDAQLRLGLRAELLQLHRDLGTTMLYVTHDQIEALTMGERIAVLHGGRLRQVGTPGEVYASPADAFVAGFVGSPGMNVLSAAPEADRKRVLACGSLRLKVPMNISGSVLLGVRPEHVEIELPGVGVGDAEVRVVEPLGSDTLVHLDAGGVALVAKVQGIPLMRAGDKVGVRIDPMQLHLFDASGARLG